MKTRRVARFDLRSAQRGPREYVPSCAPTCAALPLEQMVNLLEEYESAKGVPGSLESFDLRGTKGSNPLPSSGESTANPVGLRWRRPPALHLERSARL
jgi:hypothetical protein